MAFLDDIFMRIEFFMEILEKNHKSVRMESGLEGSFFLLPGVDNAAFRGI